MDMDVRAAWADEVEEAHRECLATTTVEDAIQKRQEVWAVRSPKIGLAVPDVSTFGGRDTVSKLAPERRKAVQEDPQPDGSSRSP